MESVAKIGTIEITRLRVYPITPGDNSVCRPEIVVQPGRYPLYREDDEIYWVMTGERNTNPLVIPASVNNLFFVTSGPDAGDGDFITAESDRFSLAAFRDLLYDPVCRPGHQNHRLNITIDDEDMFAEIMGVGAEPW